MSKVQKYTLLISISFAMVFFMLYAVLGGVNNGKPVPLAYPESGLSDDIFDSQNTEYLPNEQLSVPYAFKELPYYIDVVDGRCADVGTGHLVYGSEEITFFFSEFHKSENPHDVVLEQYPKAVYINYVKDASYVQTVASDTGFINGYYATYFIDHLLVSTGPSVSAQGAYVIGYMIELENNRSIIISLATTAETTEVFLLCKEYLDAVAYTLRFDESLQLEQERAREDALLDVQEYGTSDVESGYTLIQEVSDSAVPVMLERDFKNLSILMTWTNPSTSTSITFKRENGMVLALPETVSSKQALLEVGPCNAGMYYIDFSHYQMCGELHIKLIEN